MFKKKHDNVILELSEKAVKAEKKKKLFSQLYESF